MTYLIHTDSENLLKSIKEGIVRIPKSLINRFNLNLLKLNDRIIFFNYNDENLYGILKVTGKCYEEKNPRSGPFNGFGRVKNHYYYYSIHIDPATFLEIGLNIDKIFPLEINNFSIQSDIAELLFETLQLLNTSVSPLVVEVNYNGNHLIVSVLSVAGGILIKDRIVDVKPAFFDLLKKKNEELQNYVGEMQTDEYFSIAKDIGEYLYALLLKDMKLQELFIKGGYSISFITDNFTTEIPFDLISCCDSFLFEKNYISYIVKNKAESDREIHVNKVLIVSDPGEEYRWAYEEGKQLFKLFSNKGIECDFISRPISAVNLMDMFGNYQIVHITGHGESINRGNLEDSIAFDIGKDLFDLEILLSLNRLPNFVFFNLCSNSIKWGLNLFKNDTIENIILSRWNFPDMDNFSFIIDFYEFLLSGVEIGKAFNRQRMKSLDRQNSLLYLFSLLGDSSIKYVF